MRLFFGIDVTDEVRWQLNQVQRNLQAEGVAAGNWSRPELFHLTLLFIGDTSDEHVPDLMSLGEHTAHLARPFTLSFSRPGMFERNRILWFGLTEDEGMATLRGVYSTMVTEARKRPFIRVEERPYNPHLTLARKLDTASIPTVREVTRQAPSSSEAMFPISPLQVSSLCLFESRQEQGKLVYPIVRRFPFPTNP